MHTHTCNHQGKKCQNKIASLDSKQRQQLIAPELLIGQMPIQKNHTLLDVGAGSGFFTIPMAESTSGKVYALDSDGAMLAVIEDKAKAKDLTNIEMILDSIENLKIKNNSVDFVMASLILHEVSSLTNTLSILFDVLNTGGHLLCLEYENEDSIVEGPPMAIRIGSNELEKVLLLIGYEIVKKSKINASIYTVLAVKK